MEGNDKTGQLLKENRELRRKLKDAEKTVESLRAKITEAEETRREIIKHKKVLQQSGQQYLRLAEISPEAIFISRDNQIVYVNSAALKLFGATDADRIIGTSLFDIFLPDYNPDIRKRISDLLNGDNVHVIEEKIIRIDGFEKKVEVIAFPFDDTQGRAIQVVLRDITGREMIEQNLRQSRLDLSRAQAVANTGSWRLNTQRNELLWSEENHRIFGIPSGTPMTYETFLNIVHPDDRSYVDQKWKAGLQGEEYDIEHRILVDGNTKWVREKAFLEFDKDGVLLGGFGITQDITERKKAEEMLSWERTFVSAVLDTAGALVIVLDSEGRIIRFNRSCEKITGYSFDEVKGRCFWDFLLLPEEIEEVKSVFLQLREGQFPTEYENFWVARDGTRHLIYWTNSCLTDSNGKVEYVIGTGIDVSEQRSMEEELRRSRDELEKRVEERTLQLAHQASLIDLAYDAIVVMDFDLKITFWSQGAVETYLWTREEALGKVARVLLQTRFPKSVKEIVDEVLSQGKWEGELIQYRRDSSQIVVTSRWALQRDKNGTPVGILEINRDITQRKIAEDAIETERQRFNDVLDILPVYVILLTSDYHVAFDNRFFRERFGEHQGRRCFEYLFGRPEPCETCETYLPLKTNKPHHWEWTGPDGHAYDIFDFPFIDRDGSRLIMEMGIDITEQKNAQVAVKRGEERYRSLIVATTQIVWTTDRDGQVVGDMPSWREFTGQTIEEIQGWGWINSLHPDDRERTRIIWTESVNMRSIYQTEYHMKNRDEEYRYVSVRGVPVLEQDGSIREWVGTCTDITDRKNDERKRHIVNSLIEMFARKKLQEEYLHSVIGVIKDWSECEYIGIRVKDADGHIPYKSCIGFDDEFLNLENDLNVLHDKCVCIRTVIGKTNIKDGNLTTSGGSFFCNNSLAFSEGLDETDKKEYRGNCIKRGFKSISVIPIRYHNDILGVIHIADFQENMVPLPKVQFIETVISPLIGEAIKRFDTESELEKYRLHLEELVEQRTSELEKVNQLLKSEMHKREQISEDLARSNRDLEQFAYVASHDLQEPLRAISGFVELLRLHLKGFLDDKKTEYMSFIVDGVARMQALINGLLDYSRIRSTAKNIEITDSKTALDNTLLNLRERIKESNAKITAGQLPMVYADPALLAQLFQNLISNAIKFRSDLTPEIHINAVQKENEWLFTITDNGIGIEPQYADRIFLLFQRLHTRREYPGSGIGLPICKRIVERHGGRIWVESNEGHGSTFFFTIPDKKESAK